MSISGEYKLKIYKRHGQYFALVDGLRFRDKDIIELFRCIGNHFNWKPSRDIARKAMDKMIITSFKFGKNPFYNLLKSSTKIGKKINVKVNYD